MFGWLNKKTYSLAIDQGEALALQHKETVLNGALRHGVAFPHSCKVGGCGACKCKLVSGHVKELTDKSYLLSKEDIQAGYILGCQSIPVSDVTIALPEQAVVQTIRGYIDSQRSLTHDISEVSVRLETPLAYRPGQYATLQVTGTDIPARCYSFAHAPDAGGSERITFFVRRVPGGRMSSWLLAEQALEQRVELTGPMGDFYLREADAPMLCVAGGSGLAPLIALLEGALASGQAHRDVFLLMGARTQHDLYYRDEIDALRRQWYGRFEYVPVLSEEPAGTDWAGPRGWVTEAVNPARCKQAHGYLCGPPPMIDACMARMTQFGIDPRDIYFDKFSDQSTPVAKAS